MLLVRLSFCCGRALGLKVYELLLRGQDQRLRQLLGASHALRDPTGMHQARLPTCRAHRAGRDEYGGICDCSGWVIVDKHSVAV